MSVSVHMAHRAALCVCAWAALVSVAVGEDRTITGVGNNVSNPSRGAAGAILLRAAPAAYSDGVSAPSGVGLASPRAISNAVIHQNTTGGVIIPDPRGLTDFIWAWGQFLDHDIDLTPIPKDEPMPIAVPTGDPWFDPGAVGGVTLPFSRSGFHPATGTGPGDPREQVNIITAFIDASNVYGSEHDRAEWLREPGTGRLRVFAHPLAGDMPPFNDGTIPNGPNSSPAFFVAGDDRANETSTLLALHTLFVREHNRLADQIAAANPGWTGDEVYERARKIVGALMQQITYGEFLPALLGPGAIPTYSGYDDSIDPGVITEFSTAAYRVGHTLLSPIVLRLDEFGGTIPEGNLLLRETFFNIAKLTNEGGLAPLFRGVATGQAQKVDAVINDDVRVGLFETIGPAMDLAALNIQRSRDHGLPGLNTVRAAFGLPGNATFDDVTSDPAVAAALASVYATPGEIDPWVGMIAEDLLPGASVGETIHAVLVDQFIRLRDGDRFWFEADPALADVLDEIRATRLSDVIARNTEIAPGEIQKNVFFIPCPGDADGNLLVDGKDLLIILSAWGQDDPDADLNNDGVVDGTDLLLLLNNFGSCLD